MLSSWTLRELLRRTKAHHADADLVQLQLLGRADTLDAYRRHLLRLYGFHRPLYSLFVADSELGPAGLASPTQLHPLRDDLLALGVTQQDLARTRASAEVVPMEAPALLGWFFVCERMGLLSTLILRKLKRRLKPELFERSTSYISATSSQAAARWVQLGSLLDRKSERAGFLDRVEAGAHDAFRSQRQWFGSFRSIALQAQAC